MSVASDGAVPFAIRSIAIDTLDGVISGAVGPGLDPIGFTVGRSKQI